MAWSQPQFHIVNSIKQALTTNTTLQPIIQQCLTATPPTPHYTMHDGLLYWKNRLVIPDAHTLKQQLIQECHNSLLGSHVGYAQTLARVTAQFHWNGIL